MNKITPDQDGVSGLYGDGDKFLYHSKWGGLSPSGAKVF